MSGSDRQVIAAQFFGLSNAVSLIEAVVLGHETTRAGHFEAYPTRLKALKEQVANIEAAIELGYKPMTDSERNARTRMRKATAKVNALVRSNSWLSQIQVPSFADIVAQLPPEAGDTDTETEDAS